jgi:hypothetical protein
MEPAAGGLHGILYTQAATHKIETARPREESNLRTRIRSPPLFR